MDVWVDQNIKKLEVSSSKGIRYKGTQCVKPLDNTKLKKYSFSKSLFRMRVFETSVKVISEKLEFFVTTS